MKGNARCLIWNTEAEEFSRGSRFGASRDSPRAGGQYFIDDLAYYGWKNDSDDERARLTTWLIDRRRMGEDCPEVTTKVIEYAKRRRPFTAHERADRLLQGIASKLSDVAGAFLRHPDLSDSDERHRLAWSECVRREELEYLESYLMSRGWIQQSDPGAIGRAAQYQISVQGHSRLAELDQTATESSRAFVAMWFDESMDEAWENAIRPGIEDAGYEAVRIDKKEHAGKIDDEIIAELRRARFVVADFTQGKDGPRGGVYYEAGFAHGRDVPVIFSCRADVIEKLHFDTRQYSHIVWEAKKLDEFRDRLKTRIGAVIGDGPLGN